MGPPATWGKCPGKHACLATPLLLLPTSWGGFSTSFSTFSPFLIFPKSNFHFWSQCMSSATAHTNKSLCFSPCLNILSATRLWGGIDGSHRDERTLDSRHHREKEAKVKAGKNKALCALPLCFCTEGSNFYLRKKYVTVRDRCHLGFELHLDIRHRVLLSCRLWIPNPGEIPSVNAFSLNYAIDIALEDGREWAQCTLNSGHIQNLLSLQLAKN